MLRTILRHRVTKRLNKKKLKYCPSTMGRKPTAIKRQLVPLLVPLPTDKQKVLIKRKLKISFFKNSPQTSAIKRQLVGLLLLVPLETHSQNKAFHQKETKKCTRNTVHETTAIKRQLHRPCDT
jgi:hypothetical protein